MCEVGVVRADGSAAERCSGAEELGGVGRYGDGGAIVRWERRGIGRVGDEVPDEGRAMGQWGAKAEVKLRRRGGNPSDLGPCITERVVANGREMVMDDRVREGAVPDDTGLRYLDSDGDGDGGYGDGVVK